MEKMESVQEHDKSRLVDHLLQLGIFKINGKQLYQATLKELLQVYEQEVAHS